MTTGRAFRPTEILARLSAADVKFVVIGGIAAQYRGASYVSFDLDVCYARDHANLERLAFVLQSIHAYLRGAPPDVPFRLDAKTLHSGDAFTFTTDFGDFDILGSPAGGFDHETLSRSGDLYDMGGYRVLVAGVDDLIGMKRAAARPKDRAALEALGALREELDRRPS